jgi:hypothetical protein
MRRQQTGQLRAGKAAPSSFSCMRRLMLIEAAEPPTALGRYACRSAEPDLTGKAVVPSGVPCPNDCI